MDARRAATVLLKDRPDPERKTHIQPGCGHPAYIFHWWALDHLIGLPRKRCHRGCQQQRPDALREKFTRLPSGVQAMEDTGEIETCGLGVKE